MLRSRHRIVISIVWKFSHCILSITNFQLLCKLSKWCVIDLSASSIKWCVLSSLMKPDSNIKSKSETESMPYLLLPTRCTTTELIHKLLKFQTLGMNLCSILIHLFGSVELMVLMCSSIQWGYYGVWMTGKKHPVNTGHCITHVILVANPNSSNIHT